MTTTKKTLLAAALLAAIGATTSAQATILFDFHNGQGIQEIGAWGWSTTSFVAVGGSQAIENFASSGGTCTTACDFTVLTHANLVDVSDKDGDTLGITGLNSSFEITVQIAFKERVTGLTGSPGGSGTSAEFEILSNQGEWLQVFYSTTKNATSLSGFGYNDGTLILQGDEIVNSTGQFTINATSGASPVQLDQFSGNNVISDNYGNGSGTIGLSQLSVSGQGSQGEFSFGSFAADGSDQDSTYFISQLGEFGVNFNNLSINLPFGQVNPSDCFAQAKVSVTVGASAIQPQRCANIHTDALYSGQAADPNGGYLPVVGNINGFGPSNPDGGPDFVAQTRYNTAFATVPEPDRKSVV